MWQQTLTGVLGLWVIIYPFLGITGQANTVLLVITGIVIALLGFGSAAQRR